MLNGEYTIDIIPQSNQLRIKGFDKPLEEWQIELINVAMYPKALRPARSLTMGRLGITRSQYDYWLRHPVILKAKAVLTKRYFQDDIPDILQAMRDEAISGNVKAAEVFLKYVDEWQAEEEAQREVKKEVMTKVAVQELLDNFRKKKV